jgi:DNA polymerase III alpha subunit (gram-positive type)
MRKYFIFDCEMGGLHPKMSLLTLHGILLNSELQEIDRIDLTIKPNNGQYLTTAQAMSVNKIDLVKHDKVAIPEREAAKQFYNFAFRHGGQEKMIPAGHNLSLDIRFAKKHLLKDPDNAEGDAWGKFFSHRRLDTATIAHYLILAGKLPENLDGSLWSLAQYFGISYDGAHNAKFDAELSLKILKKLIGLVDGAPLY